MKISIITPVYNVEKYIHRCIDSILAQTFTDFELLLIDDGSKDNSGKICDEYAKSDKRIRVFHKENGGVSSARNLGVDEAKGEYISFIDPDDWIELNMYEEIFNFVDENNVDVAGKFATQITTSKHFWDITAHRYIEDNCQDMGMRFIKGLSADMDDLLTEKGQKEATDFFDYVVFCMNKNIYEKNSVTNNPG